jgi:glycosyltransferase involved in cell wall biosynthesis
MNPRVTVLTAFHNEERFLSATIDSVLKQSFADFELLLVDDASTDRSAEIVRGIADPRIRLLSNESNLGLTKSLNRGIALARGEYVARLDANDLCLPERLRLQVAYLDAHPNVGVVGGQAGWIDVHGRPVRHLESTRPVTELGIEWYSIFSPPIVHSTAMFRLDVVRDQLGGYDEKWTVGQDADLWERVGEQNRVANLAAEVIRFRIDPRSISGALDTQLRVGHVERRIELSRRRQRRHLATSELPAEWPRIWAGLNETGVELSADEIAAFPDLVEALHERFCTLHPEARMNAEVRRFCALLISRAVFRLIPLRRWHSQAFFRIFRYDIAVGFRLLPKYLALCLLGDRARRLVTRVRRPGRPEGMSP